jgi:DNA processing protein
MDDFYWFALKAIPLVGNVTFCRLLAHFATPEKVLRASADELSAVKGLFPDTIASIKSYDYRAEAERECKAVLAADVTIINILSDSYPKILTQIADPPPFLYVKGELPVGGVAVAIVGSRRASSCGMMIAEKLARELVENDITVVSGMARGIDTAAHRGALKAGGHSIGVLGCGIDIQYPAENRQLFNGVRETGALVSEFPMGTTPRAENFPRRNRIISGLSRGVLVVEAAENSGSLITARYALEQGRDVFAIPGNITHGSSRGTNRLIKQGAKLVEGIEDILEELPQGIGNSNQTTSAKCTLAPLEAAVYTFLSDAPLHIDEIIVKSALTVGEVSVILLRLELNGLVIQLPGNHYTVS